MEYRKSSGRKSLRVSRRQLILTDTSSPSFATAPLTVILWAWMSSSIARREPTPACASTWPTGPTSPRS